MWNGSWWVIYKFSWEESETIKLGIFDTEQIVLVQGSNCLDKKSSQHPVLTCDRANLRLIQGLLCVIMQGFESIPPRGRIRIEESHYSYNDGHCIAVAY